MDRAGTLQDISDMVGLSYLSNEKKERWYRTKKEYYRSEKAYWTNLLENRIVRCTMLSYSTSLGLSEGVLDKKGTMMDDNIEDHKDVEDQSINQFVVHLP